MAINDGEQDEKRKKISTSSSSSVEEDEDHGNDEDLYTSLLKKDEEIAELKRSFLELKRDNQELHSFVKTSIKNNPRLRPAPSDPGTSATLASTANTDTSFTSESVNQKGVDPPHHLELIIKGSSSEGTSSEETHSDDDNEEKDDGEENPFRRSLSEDTFSLMIISSPQTPAFWFALTVFLLQMGIFTLVAASVIDRSAPDNVLGIPPNVTFTVRIAQLIAILVSVATQEDLRTSLTMAYDGYDKKSFGVFEQSSFGLWVFANAIRSVEGFVGLIVTFFLIMTESEEVSLLLNFTAIEFVSQLDEAAFYLARQGFVGKKNQLQAETLENTDYYVLKRSRRLVRICILLVLLTSMLVGFAFVIGKQQKGAFLCSSVFVQFSDDFLNALGTFTGLYDRVDVATGLKSLRPIYVEERSGEGIFAYCDDEEAWTFGWGQSREDDPCSNWVAISEETATFDLVEAGQLNWFVSSENLAGIVPLQYFYMSCYDCDDPSMSEDEVCGGKGTCVENRCECKNGSIGLLCEFSAPCPSLAVDESFGGFLGTREFSESFFALKDDDGTLMQAYDRPVYVNVNDNENEFLETEMEPTRKKKDYEIILFTGRRWILSYSFIIPGLTGSDLEDLKDFVKKFHGHFSDYQSAFISGPIDVVRPSNAATPIQKDWFQPSAETQGTGIQAANENFPLDVSLICAQCSEVETCSFNSTCLSSGICKCTTGAHGARCQVAPVHDGKCDSYFNTPEFGFDGGDCCESSCVSSDEYFCGKDESGFIDIGYPICSVPSDVWMVNGGRIRSDIGGFARAGAAVALSSNGAVLAVSEPGYDSVRIFDRDGSIWLQRGRTIEGSPNSNFGSRLALSGQLDTAVKNPISANTFTLAVSGNDGTTFFRCAPTGCFSFPTEKKPDFGPRVAFRNRYVLDSTLQVYTIEGGEFVERGSPVNFLPPPFRKLANHRELAVGLFFDPAAYLCISEDGNTVVIGTMNGQFICGVGISDASLSVDAYRYYGGFWIAMDITFKSDSHLLLTTTNSFPSQSIALSGDGRVLAIASKFDTDSTERVSGVRIYKRNQNEEWIDQGLVTGDSDEGVFAWGVDLSSDGSTMVVAGNGERGTSVVRTYRWNDNGEKYVQHLNDIPGGEEIAVAISSDGGAIAVGRPSAGTGGEAVVFGSVSRCPSDTQKSFRVSVTTDDNEGETRWEAKDTTGNVILRGGPYSNAAFTTFVDEVCVDLHNECITFTIYDDVSADGIKSPGGYAIVIDGEVVFKGDSFGPVERSSYGSCGSPCDAGASQIQVVMYSDVPFEVKWVVDDYQGQAISEGAPYDVLTVFEEFCVPSSSSECLSFAISGGGCRGVVPGMPELNYALFLDGELQVEGWQFFCEARRFDINTTTCPPTEIPLLDCEADTELLRVETSPFTPPSEQSFWSIQQACETTKLLEVSDYNATDFGKLFVEQACIPKDLPCLIYVQQFFSLDAPSYSIQLGGDVVLSSQVPFGPQAFSMPLDPTEDCRCDASATDLAPRTSTLEASVSCGNHIATSCTECLEVDGSTGCTGDCIWQDEQCVPDIIV